MFLIESKRFCYSKKIWFVLIIGILIIGMNYFLSAQYDITEDMKALALFNSFTQFSFLLLPTIVATAFNTDFSKGHPQFFAQIGYSKMHYFFAKIAIYSSISIVYTVLFSLLSAQAFNVEVMGILFLNIEFIILLSLLASLIFDNKIYAVLFLYFGFFVGDIANMIEGIQGYALLPDKNSVSTAYVSQIYGATVNLKPGVVVNAPAFMVLIGIFSLSLAIILGCMYILFQKKGAIKNV